MNDITTAYLPHLMTMCAAGPPRMIYIAVYHALDDDCKNLPDAYGVTWHDVIAFLCVHDHEYVYNHPRAIDTPRVHHTHQEMRDAKWMPSTSHEYERRILPVIAGNQAADEGPVRAIDEQRDTDNCLYSTVAVCHWPPDQDQENAVRIARQLIQESGGTGNWTVIGQAGKQD